MEYPWFYWMDFIFNSFPANIWHILWGREDQIISWASRAWEIIFLTNWFWRYFSMLTTLSKKIFFRYFAVKSLVCPFILSSNVILSQENYLKQNRFSKNKDILFVLSIFFKKNQVYTYFVQIQHFFAINYYISF